MEGLSRRAKERRSHEDAIVLAAEKAYVEKGYEKTSMEEIARNSEFTKRTLYQYFGSKEELYFAVVLSSMRKMATFVAQEVEGAQTGFQQIRRLVHALYQFSRDFPRTFALISEWGYIKKRSPEAQPSLEKLDGFNSELFGRIAAILGQGVSDGSIRADVNVERTACSVIFLITGFLTQLSTTGDSFIGHFRLDREEFCRSTIDMVLKTLEPTGNRDPLK